jgi:hypothetical protein
MDSCRPGWLLAPVVVCMLAHPLAASAQPPLMGVIHAGTLSVSTSSTRPQVSLAGGIVDVTAAFDDGTFEPELCRPCVSGAKVGVGGRLAAAGKGNAFYEGDFTFTGPAIEVPENAAAELVLTSAFTFQGRVIVSSRRESRPEEKEPAIELDGGGTVTITLTSSIDPETGARLYFFQDATYQFSPSGR